MRIILTMAACALLAACPGPDGIVTAEPTPRPGDAALFVHMPADMPPAEDGRWLAVQPSQDRTRLEVSYSKDWDAQGCTVRLVSGPHADPYAGFLAVACDGLPRKP